MASEVLRRGHVVPRFRMPTSTRACHPILRKAALGLEIIVQRVLEGQAHDYLFVGHSHVKLDTRVGRVRVINPGALHRAREKTVATLDTGTDLLRFITVAV